MSINYLIDKPCRLKKELGEREAARLFKIKAIVDMVDKTSFLPLNERKTFSVESYDGELPREESITVAKMREYILPLLKFRNHCVNCPANVFKRDFGCSGTIEFPIAQEVEEVLMETLRLSLENHREKSAGYFVQYLCCQNIRCDEILQMRHTFYEAGGLGKRYPKFFVLPQGLEYSWGGKWIFCKNYLSTDEIFQFSFFSGTLGEQALQKQAGFFALFYEVAEMELGDLRRRDVTKANRFYKGVYQFQDFAAALTRAASREFTFSVNCIY